MTFNNVSILLADTVTYEWSSKLPDSTSGEIGLKNKQLKKQLAPNGVISMVLSR